MSKITIGICGSPSSGKTTISQLLKWKIQNILNVTLETTTEYARNYIEKYGQITNIYQQFLIYEEQTKIEKQIQNIYDITISDSPRFLSYIYSKKIYDYKNEQEREILLKIYEKSLESLKDYDIIYLLPVNPKIKKDEVRNQDKKTSHILFQDMKIFLKTHCPELFCFIKNHKNEKSIKTVNFIIKDLMEKMIIK